MAATPRFKVYVYGEYVAACKYAEDAAAMAGLSNHGIVKLDHKKVLWREGEEELEASESYDGAARIMRDRMKV